jgi:hypothetical protein
MVNLLHWRRMHHHSFNRSFNTFISLMNARTAHNISLIDAHKCLNNRLNASHRISCALLTSQQVAQQLLRHEVRRAELPILSYFRTRFLEFRYFDMLFYLYAFRLSYRNAIHYDISSFIACPAALAF